MLISKIIESILKDILDRKPKIAFRAKGNQQYQSSRKEPIDRLVIENDSVVCIYVGGDTCISWMSVGHLMKDIDAGFHIRVGNYEGSGPI